MLIINTYNLDVNLIKYIRLDIFFIIFLSVLISISLIAKRLQIILGPIIKFKFFQIINYSLISFVLNITTFAGSGEIIKYFLIKNKIVTTDKLISSFFIEKFYGIISSFIIVFSIIFFFENIQLLVIFLISFFLLVKFILKKNLLLRHIPYLNFNEYSLSQILKKINNAKVYIISICIHLTFIIQFYFIFKFYEINISNYQLLIFILFLMVMNSLPFFFMGFGSRELAIVIFSSIYSVDIQTMLNVTLSFGLIYFFIAFLLSIFVYFISLNYLKINVSKIFLKKKFKL